MHSLFGQKYLKGTLILGFYSMSLQLIGCNIMNIFSNRIITDVNKNVPDSRKILANRAT